jgi:hypothetical protein
MSQTAVIIEQLEDIKVGVIPLPWQGKEVNFNYAKTRNGYVFGRVLDIAAAMAGIALDGSSANEKIAFSKAISKKINTLEKIEDAQLKDAVKEVACSIPSSHVSSCRLMSPHVSSCRLLSAPVGSCRLLSPLVASCRLLSPYFALLCLTFDFCYLTF